MHPFCIRSGGIVCFFLSVVYICTWVMLLSMKNNDAVDFQPPPFEESMMNRPWSFRLAPGSVTNDEAALRVHKWRIGKGLHEKNHDATAIAITAYFAELVGMNDTALQERIKTFIESHLEHSAPCPAWNLDFEGPAEYILCDCTGHAIKDAHAAMEQTGDMAIRVEAEQIMKEHALRKISECNFVYAWSLLGMLYAEHGFEAGPHLFKDEGLFKKTHKIDKAKKQLPKLTRAKMLLQQAFKQLDEGRDEMQYEIMDIITDALNRMHTINNKTWIYRMQKAIDKELELRPLPTTASPETVPPPSASIGLPYLVVAIVLLLIVLTIYYLGYRDALSDDDDVDVTPPALEAAPIEQAPLPAFIEENPIFEYALVEEEPLSDNETAPFETDPLSEAMAAELPLRCFTI